MVHSLKAGQDESERALRQSPNLATGSKNQAWERGLSLVLC